MASLARHCVKASIPEIVGPVFLGRIFLDGCEYHEQLGLSTVVYSAVVGSGNYLDFNSLTRTTPEGSGYYDMI